MDFVLLPEYVSAIFIIIYIANSLLDSKVSLIQDVFYRISLYTVLASIFFSIFTSYTAMHTILVSHTLNVAANSAYFAFTFLMITTISLTLFAVMFEGRTETKAFKAGFCIMIGLYVLSFAVILLNVKTGCLFSVDENENYVRGPFNTMTYWLMLVYIAVGVVFSLHQRKHLRRSFKRIVITLPVATSVMALYQVLFPNTMLTGTVATLALTTMLIYGQQQRIHVDHLTALAGREMFYRTLQHFSTASRLFTVIFISLRDYKAINSRFGQLAGDDFLRVVAGFLGSLNKNAVACRYSGVEFALVLPNLPDDEYACLFEKLCTRFDEPWECDGNRVMLSASIVDIKYPEHAKSVNELISSLEFAVRQAKLEKRGSVLHFDTRYRNAAGRFHYVLSQMTETPDERFFIVFQPVHDCHTGLPRGAEVLVRLRDENGRTIMPGEFIPLAEETGYVNAIDWFVMEQACRFLSEHRDCGIEWLSVNLTPFVHGETLIANIERLLKEYGIPAGALKLEVTERLFSENADLLDKAIQDMRICGVGVYLDDFGTGYSNLYQTFRLPFECVKIDRAFVNDIETQEHAREFLDTLIKILHGMGSSVTVEGVETMAQRDIVKRLDADMIQGYYYAKPMLPDAFLDYMRNNIQ